MQRRAVLLALAGATIMAAVPLAAAPRELPYWASIGASRARMRTGPARTYPATWLYRRPDLPVRVIAVFKDWRRIEDPDGETGWMQGTLLRYTRTVLVRGTEPVAMRDAPDEQSRLQWRVAPGVVGRVSQCANGWCRLDVHGKEGFVSTAALWGVEPDENLP